jgi:sugar transferase (PEP-CTERM/EpsH1 system associated)
MSCVAASPPLIAHVIHRLDFGGLENGLVNLINLLPADEFRHAVVSLTTASSFRNRLRPGIEVIELNRRDGQDWNLYRHLYRTFRRLRPAIVHTRNLATLEAQLPAWLAGVRGRIHGEHGRDVHDLDNKARKYRWLRRAFVPLVQRYIPLSQELERYLGAEVGVSARKIRRICNGVDTARFAPAEHARAWLDAAPFAAAGRIVIGSLGRMAAVKDPLLLADAFIRLVAQLPEGRARLALVMAGDGDLRPRVAARLAEAGLASICWLPGSRNDTAEFLRALDIFVLPSLAEGISNTILEAMASGLPVVATDVGGNAELVRTGVTGALVPRADPEALAAALYRYVADPELRRAHGMAGRERAVSEFSLENMVANYAKVYREVLG